MNEAAYITVCGGHQAGECDLEVALLGPTPCVVRPNLTAFKAMCPCVLLLFHIPLQCNSARHPLLRRGLSHFLFCRDITAEFG